MLAAAYRLRRSNDIARVVRQGYIISTPYIRIHALLNPDQPHSRVACVAGKKIHPSAVQRHTYQRWLRECANLLLPQLSRPYDIVLMARPSIKTLSRWSDILATLDSVADKLDKSSL